MSRTVGTTVRGIRAPIVREGDDLVRIVVDAVLRASAAENFRLHDRDVIGVTEALVARAQGNYASVGDIAEDVRRKFTGDVAVVFPLLSRNRFAPILKGIAASGRKVYVYLSYPADEVGNHLMDVDALAESGLNPWQDVLTAARYRELFGENVAHPFTGIDYVKMYQELAPNIEIFLANDARAALQRTKEIIVANVHERHRIKRLLLHAGAERVLGLDELLTTPLGNSGYNPDYGLLGANMAGDDRIKLFPRDSQEFVEAVQAEIRQHTGQLVEVMVYGDGAFKDPMGRIWELADPVVSPGFTRGLEGRPNEIKLKYVADNELAGLSGEALTAAMRERLRARAGQDENGAASLGTTPRQLTDLLGSLCDLTSGSGDKGTPIVLVQGYFDNYASE